MEKKDWYFIIPTTVVWATALTVTAWDFIYRQGAKFHFSGTNIVGLLLLITGVIIQLIAILTLGKNYSPVLINRKEQQLVTHGIYKYIRHPFYLGDVMANLGITLFFSSFFGFLIMLLLIPLFLYRISIEEQMLKAKFGKDYTEYCRKTKKLIPYIY